MADLSERSGFYTTCDNPFNRLRNGDFRDCLMNAIVGTVSRALTLRNGRNERSGWKRPRQI